MNFEDLVKTYGTEFFSLLAGVIDRRGWEDADVQDLFHEFEKNYKDAAEDLLRSHNV